METHEVAVGPFRIDPHRRLLTRDGQPVKVGGRALDVLCVLASSVGETVAKDDLLSRVWPREVVEENALQVHVSALRRILAEGTNGHNVIVTDSGRGYRLVGQRSDAAAEPAPEAQPEVRSIAVLPFWNLSNDPEQDYFADGVVDEIITGLSRLRWLQVIGRNSSFALKGKAINLKLAGQTLGARYLLEGSVRKSTNRVRIAVQLVDASTGLQIWADRFERELVDIFALQDEVTMRTIGALEPNLRRAEVERVRRKRPESLDAYDCLLRAMPYVHSHVAGDALQAIPLLQQALQHAPDYGAAHASLALCFHSRFSRAGLHEEDRAAAIHHARASLRNGVDDPTSLAIAGFVISLDEHDHNTACDLFDRALAISDSSVFALRFSALALAWQGASAVAAERARRAIALSPLDPLNFLAWNALAIASFSLGEYRVARDAASNSTQINPGLSVSHAFLAAALLRLSESDAARTAAAQVTVLDASFTISRFAVTVGIQPRVYGPFAEAWALLGLPAGN